MALTTVNSSGVKDDSIVNADIKSDAAIAGTKISSDFGTQNIVTTGQVQATAQTPAYFKRAVTGTSPVQVLIGNNTRTWALEAHSTKFSINDHTAVNVPRIGIDENGYVGIGTADADRKFHILDAGSAYLRLTNASTSISNGTITGMIEFEHKDSSGAGVAAAIRSEIKDTDTGSATLNFSTGTPSSLGTRMTILPDGKVGIGTESPTGKVTIKNADDANINVFEVKNDNDNVSGGFSQSSAGDGTLFSKRNDGTLSIFFRSNGISYLNGGNVGIARTDPSTALDVNGEVSVPVNNVIRWRETANTNTKLDMYTNASGVLILRNSSASEIYRLDASGNITIPGGMYLDADDKYMYLGADQDAWVGHTGASAQIVNSTGWLFIGNGTESNDAPIYIRTHNSYNQITLFSTEHSSRPGEVALCAGATGAERLTTASYGIYVEGNVKVPNGSGIDFSATADASGMSSELLDAYEEGVYTPNITAESSGSWTASTYNKIAYTRIGRQVHIQGYISIDSQSSPSGDVRIDLPFTVVNNLSSHADYAATVCQLRGHTGATSLYNVIAAPQPGETFLMLNATAGDGSNVWLDHTHCGSSWNIRLGGSYICA